MITREEAIDAIYEVINSGILKDELEAELTSTAEAILFENYGLHVWGADIDEEAADFDPYVFAPADYEEEAIKANIDKAVAENTAENTLTDAQSEENSENDK